MSSTSTISVLDTIAGLRRSIEGSAPVVLVPTMGALHEGHLDHVRRAAELASTIVVSIFVNPLQFGPGEDLAKYPRDLAGDLEKLAAAGATHVFAPSVEEMYPSGQIETKVTAGRIGGMFEGRSRAGHYDGVLTVVSKLLNIVRPQFVTFGQKDAQQLFLVRRMVRDLDVPVTVEVIETHREHDGLAMSSRNRFLDPGQRRAALALFRSLEAAVSAGERGIDAVIASSQSVFDGETELELDYFAVVDPATFLPVDDDYRGRALAIVAARVGTTRLIDNELIRLS